MTPDEHDNSARLPYPRRCDTILKRAHSLLVYALGGAVCLFVLWAALTEIDQVTRGSGRVVPQVRNQIVQHLEGGIVSEILVREGDVVAAGQPLLRVENSFNAAELAEARIEVKAIRARIARLDAEIDGSDIILFDEALRADVPDIVEREGALFRRRAASLAAQIDILQAQSRQKGLELSELRARWTNTQRERELVRERVESLRRLVQRGAVSNNELLQVEGQLQQVETRIADLVHDIPRTEEALSEITRRVEEARLRFREESETERSEAALEVAKLEERISAMIDRSARSEVTAPIAGVVNKLFVATVGGVVRSGEPLAELVPADASIAVEVRLSPADRAEVWPGLPAVVKVSAYEYSIYGGLSGRVVDISPDALTDQDGTPYFRVRLEADSTGFGPDHPVVPGMLAQVDILSQRRTILDYLLRPVREVTANALRE